ncbi:MAG: tetratricopeptide repeat protein, partial [Pseudomonadota bacterium]|nr:tetratricopeptide repeat protein [Pseudomonadota bacterium]
LVDFWAPWCEPCKALTPAIEAAVHKFSGRVVLAKVNVDEQQEWAQRAGVRGIPNVKLIIGGRVANEFTGVLPQAAIEQFLDKALPPPPSDLLADADALLADGQFEQALGALQQAATDPATRGPACLRLARLLLLDDPVGVEHFLDGISETDKEYGDAQAIRRVLAFIRDPGTNLPESPARAPYLNAAQQLSSGNINGAFEQLIEAVRLDRKFEEDIARKRLVDLFDWLGAVDERTREYRLKLYDVL